MNESQLPIVVGIDGSEDSNDALLWAAKQAELTGAAVRAVIAWQSQSSYGYYVDYSDTDAAADARTMLERAVTAALGDSPTVPVTLSVVKGKPAQVLIDASRSAELLVVGSRGLGGFSGALLGSVSQQCVRHAACPVLVIRTPAKQVKQ